MRDLLRGDGVVVDVGQDVAAIDHVADHLGLEAAFDERAVASAGAIKPAGVLALDVGHRRGQLAYRAADQQMEVVDHQAKRVDLQSAGAHLLGEEGEELPAIPLAFEHRALGKAAVGAVMPPSRSVVAESVSHAFPFASCDRKDTDADGAIK